MNDLLIHQDLPPINVQSSIGHSFPAGIYNKLYIAYYYNLSILLIEIMEFKHSILISAASSSSNQHHELNHLELTESETDVG